MFLVINEKKHAVFSRIEAVASISIFCVKLWLLFECSLYSRAAVILI